MIPPLVENYEELSKDELHAIKIEDTTLPGRAKNVLLKPESYAGNVNIGNKRWYEGHPECADVLETVGQLVDKTFEQVLWRRGCGRKTAFRIRDSVRATGLRLRGDE